METTMVDWGYIRKMEKNVETTVVYWGYMGIMENKVEATIGVWELCKELATFSWA